MTSSSKLTLESLSMIVLVGIDQENYGFQNFHISNNQLKLNTVKF